MADAVDTEVLFSSENKYAVRFTNLSDGTGETTVTKVDRSALIGPDGINAPAKLVVEAIDYDVQGFEGVHILWNNTSNESLAILSGSDIKEYKSVGGLVPDADASGALTGTVGDILITTNGTAALGDTYDITLFLRLKMEKRFS